MTISLVFLAVMMAFIVGWLLRQTINVQPWVAQASAHSMQGSFETRSPVKIALWVFLGVATSLFALFISAYAMRINFLDWSPLPQPRLLMVNSVVLALASVAMEWSVFAARRNDLGSVRNGLLTGGVLTLAFLAGQLYVWKQLADAGFFLSTSAATGFFYLLTAVHGLHLIGGLVAWVRNFARVWRAAPIERIRLGVELCATYWHFLLVVWLVLLAVLVSDTLGLAICAPSVPL
jgi:cytochrome c oxidase subunit III